ncbi:MAG TPA: amidohydrolase family protein, partial [Longimicrobiales bacterium]|nr:amidohydrolase family protein [Longimicrobiales bacterium]
KVVGAPMWGSSQRTLAMIDSARAAGTDARVDQYPYTATYTGISILVPAWARAGGNEAFQERLADPVLHDSIVDGIIFNIVNDRGAGDIDRVQLARVSWDRSLEGGTLADWARREGLDPTPETGAQLVIEAMRRGGASAIYHALEEDDVRRIMRHPQTMVASDGRLTRPGEGHPHPRWYGTFPRVLGHYVREQGVLDLPEAVHKMTALPAALMGLRDRGEIREDAFADLVVFDPETVTDRATFQDPHQYPVGIPFVLVNGVVTVDEGEFLDVRPGRALRRARDSGAPLADGADAGR